MEVAECELILCISSCHPSCSRLTREDNEMNYSEPHAEELAPDPQAKNTTPERTAQGDGNFLANGVNPQVKYLLID